MTSIHLIRHTDHDWIERGLAGRLAVPLNDDGVRQAEALGRWYAGQRVECLWASPLRRTMQTADPIARALGLEIRTADELLEVDFGAWEGKEFIDLDHDPAWPRWNTARGRARAPGGETIAAVQARVCGFINDLCDRDPHGSHVLVSHGDPIRAALAYYLGVPIDLFLRIEVYPGSISLLAIDGCAPRILRMNGSVEDGSLPPAPSPAGASPHPRARHRGSSSGPVSAARRGGGGTGGTRLSLQRGPALRTPGLPVRGFHRE